VSITTATFTVWPQSEAAAAREDRRFVLAAAATAATMSWRARQHHADRHLPVVGASDA
jgi:hypothetical protein